MSWVNWSVKVTGCKSNIVIHTVSCPSSEPVLVKFQKKDNEIKETKKAIELRSYEYSGCYIAFSCKKTT